MLEEKTALSLFFKLSDSAFFSKVFVTQVVDFFLPPITELALFAVEIGASGEEIDESKREK